MKHSHIALNNSSLLVLFFILSCSNSSPNQPKFGQREKDSASIANAIQPDTAKRPFQIVFEDVAELQEGSLYNGCKIKFIGADKIQLPEALWQDKFSWSEDSKKLVLIQWLPKNVTPGFIFFIIDTETGRITEGIKMAGAVNNLQIKGDTINYSKFYYEKDKSSDTLCCSFQEDYIIRK